MNCARYLCKRVKWQQRKHLNNIIMEFLIKSLPHNVNTFMTRRYPNLPQKKLQRDSKVARQVIQAWDEEGNEEKVVEIYLRNAAKLSDERYWELMRTVWIICGSVKNNKFRELMRSKRKQRHYFSTPEEIAYLQALPDKITVYRATNDAGDKGLSYTLSSDYAVWYKEQYKKDMILTLEVEKKNVFAYIERNGESEIILL